MVGFEEYLTVAIAEPTETDVASYTRTNAVEQLVWSLFLEHDTPEIYHQLSILAEQEDTTGEDILHAWEIFSTLRQTRTEPITKGST